MRTYCPECTCLIDSTNPYYCGRCGYVDYHGVTFTEPDTSHSYKTQKKTGLGNSYYELPKGAKELQDLIEYRNMNFAVGNIFKAAYRLGHKEENDATYELEKIIWFAQRELERIKNEDVISPTNYGNSILPDARFTVHRNSGRSD